MSPHLKKALIIFAKCPVPGQVKTRLAPLLSPAESAELYRCMLEDTVAKAASLDGVDKFLFYEGEAAVPHYFEQAPHGMPLVLQEGETLGERMAAAFRQIFAAGFGTAVIIGTDSPDLPVSYIEKAYGLLEGGETDAVFGPSADGGYYLLGMRALHTALFHEIPWSSADVLRESLRQADEAGLKVSLLPPWHDVDLPEDLARPELVDENNGAPLTRAFLTKRHEVRGSRSEDRG